MIVDEETPSSFLKDRVKSMGFKKQWPIYFMHFRGLRIDDPDQRGILIQRIREINPVLIVFDSLRRIHQQRENLSEAMSQVIGYIKSIINRTGTTAIIIHHHTKARGSLETRARGSSDITAVVDIEYAITKQKNFLTLQSVKTRVKPFDPIKLSIDEAEDGSLKVSCHGIALDEKQAKAIKSIMDCCADGEGSSFEDIKEYLKITEVGIGKEKLRLILNDLTVKGELIEDKEAHNKKMWTVAEDE